MVAFCGALELPFLRSFINYCLIKELHYSHLGMSHMKSFSRSYYGGHNLIHKLKIGLTTVLNAVSPTDIHLKHSWLVPQHL